MYVSIVEGVSKYFTSPMRCASLEHYALEACVAVCGRPPLAHEGLDPTVRPEEK